MPLLRFLRGIFLLCAAAGAAQNVCGQNYPDKAIRIVTINPGSGVDLIARTFAQRIAGALGQPIVVDNRGSIVGGEIVSKAGIPTVSETVPGFEVVNMNSMLGPPRMPAAIVKRT